VASSVTSLIGVLGAVKTKAKAAVGMGASAAPIAVDPDPGFEAQVARVDELTKPVAGALRAVEMASNHKRGHAYELSRLGHYLTQVASLEEAEGLPATGMEEGEGDGGCGGCAGRSRGRGDKSRGRGGKNRGSTVNAEQILGQRMERVATAYLEAIDQEETELLEPLREQLGYLASASEVQRARGRALTSLQARTWTQRTLLDANASLHRNKQRLHAASARGDSHAAAVSRAKMD
ncbi:unnamed protein product, partial [Discosporangium mesarthrocarpum]